MGNSAYHISYGGEDPIHLCSKEYKPEKGDIAIMICHDAAKKCSTIDGLSTVFHLPYADPQFEDEDGNSQLRDEQYDKASNTISAEMMYLFARLRLQKSNDGAGT